VRVSVALCTYNGERFLDAQLDSLLAQSRLPDEIVACDDASSDGTWELLQAFAARATERGVEVRLQRNAANLGYVRNFGQALQAAGGELLFPCDQDDAWHPRRIELCVQAFARDPGLLLLHTDARLVDAAGEPLGRRLFEVLGVTAGELAAMHAGRAAEVLLRRNIVTGATMALRRGLLAQALPVAEGWVHDEWLAVVAALVGRVDTLEEATIDYRQHGGNQLGARERSLGERADAGARRDYREAMAAKMRALARRVETGGLQPPAEARALLRERLRHDRVRTSLPRARWQRIVPVLGELRAGGYARFGTGLRGALLDLAGPAGGRDDG
jgi:Glycosyltransferases involved in cell wall biogenesis